MRRSWITWIFYGSYHGKSPWTTIWRTFFIGARWWQLKDFLEISPRSLGRWSKLTGFLFETGLKPPTRICLCLKSQASSGVHQFFAQQNLLIYRWWFPSCFFRFSCRRLRNWTKVTWAYFSDGVTATHLQNGPNTKYGPTDGMWSKKTDHPRTCKCLMTMDHG